MHNLSILENNFAMDYLLSVQIIINEFWPFIVNGYSKRGTRCRRYETKSEQNISTKD